MGTSYLAGSTIITAAGDTTPSNYFVYRAGINTYSLANYHTQDHRQIILSLVPDGVLPTLSDSLEALSLSFRDERLIQMVAKAAKELLTPEQNEMTPLILAGPENYQGLINQLPKHFLRMLHTQVKLPIDYSASRTLSTGRTGVIESIRLAQHYLDSGKWEQVLVGGVDSCQHSQWLQMLERSGRLKSESSNGRSDCFVPGEGASFLLLTRNPDLAQQRMGAKIQLNSPGFGNEPGHLYSNSHYLGQGLDQAVKEALIHLPDPHKISLVFSSMNGENYWAKEFGIAMTRSSHRISELNHEHPADCYGDLGAASGGALIALAAQMYSEKAFAGNCLVCTSSDSSYRAALTLKVEGATL